MSEPTQPPEVLNTGTGMSIGIGLVGLGFAAVVFAWNKIAALTKVAEQVPYFMSSGLGGLALIILGAVTLDVTVRRRSSRERRAQMAELSSGLRELRQRLEPDDTEGAREGE